MKEKWDERYSQQAYAYGEEPNNYLKKQLQNIPVGTILFPAEGEGRNAVFAASLGWKVFAFDQSMEGKKKALQLATKKGVSITYDAGEFQTLSYAPDQFDAIALIYAHFPADKKSSYHQVLSTYLRPGGIIIFEAFSKSHLEYLRLNDKVGGPGNLESLFSVDEIKTYFKDFDIIQLVEEEIELKEGLYHNGKGAVIRFTGRKK